MSTIAISKWSFGRLSNSLPRNCHR